jgi:hypothetical protein
MGQDEKSLNGAEADLVMKLRNMAILAPYSDHSSRYSPGAAGRSATIPCHTVYRKLKK